MNAKVESQIEKARILYNQRRHKLAAEELAQALGQDPENAEAISLYAVTLAQLGDIKQALEKNALALGKEPDNPQFHYRSGIIWRRAGNLTNAADSLLEAIRLNPRNPDYYSYLSNLCCNQRQYEDALEFADKGLACAPEHIGCLNERACALICLKRNTEAAATLDHFLKLSPNDANAHALRGWLEINNNNPKHAEASFLEALRYDPEYANARQGLARARKDKNPVRHLFNIAVSNKTIYTTLLILTFVALIILLVTISNYGLNNINYPVIGLGYIVSGFMFLLLRNNRHWKNPNMDGKPKPTLPPIKFRPPP